VKVFAVAMDLLREAASRKWFLALAVGITAVLGILAFALRLDVVDGALAATKFFGKSLDSDIQSVDVALRPVFQATAYMIFYGGLAFGIVACADFGPSLLAPGRIEHLLALPLRRWELLAGTFLGVLVLSVSGALYGAGGLALILGVKTGVYTFRPVLAALLASVTFSAIYGAMLAIAVVIRSAAISAATGVLLLIAGTIAGYRDKLDPFFESGIARTTFRAVTLFLPRVSTLANASSDLAGSMSIDGVALASQVAGLSVFGFAALALGIHLFEQKDF
jgi:ABC-type transport system involved in multi-copper enzyme maturation permease subunit